jgi:ubiquinone/menaquinone biosynthesis C-methylase UbiE
MPFPAASFDVAWTEHAAMNIADKPTLYREMQLERGSSPWLNE